MDRQSSPKTEIGLMIVVQRRLAEEDLMRNFRLLRLSHHAYKKYERDGICHEYQARMLMALDCGYEALALEIMRIDAEFAKNWKGGYSSSSLSKNGVKDLPHAAFSDVLEIIMTITNINRNGILRCLLEGQVGKLVFDRRELLPRPLDLNALNLFDEADRKSAYRPVIYALVHCDEAGKAPTIEEYLRVIERIRQYISIDEDKWVENDAYAKMINYAGHDTHPRIPRERDWSAGLGGNPKWAQTPHPRRYASNESTLKSFDLFLKKFEARILRLGPIDRSKPLPWHLTYIGWTNKFERRLMEHYRHTTGQDIKALVETITYIECQPKKYFMRMIPLTNIRSPAMVRAEHVISLLTCSYAFVGGLNGVSGGSSKDTAAAASNPEGCWEAGLSALSKQEPELNDIINEYHRQVTLDNSFKEVRALDGEIRKMEDELKMLKEATVEELVADAEDFQQLYDRQMAECDLAEVALKLWIRTMRFVDQVDKIVEDYPEIVEDSQGR